MSISRRAAVVLASIGMLTGACSKNEPRCFECGLADEWARADREHAAQALQEDQDRQAQLKAAVANGDERVLFDAVSHGDLRYVEVVVKSLEESEREQSELLLDWTYELLIHASTANEPLREARARAFVLIAVSRGLAARPLLEACAATSLAERCADALGLIAERAARSSAP
jgi:hypothetical protein